MSEYSSDESMDDNHNEEYEDSDQGDEMPNIPDELREMIEEDDQDESDSDPSDEDGDGEDYGDGMEEDELDIEDEDLDEDEMVEEMDDGVIGLEITGNGMPPNAIARARRTLERLANLEMHDLNEVIGLSPDETGSFPTYNSELSLPSSRREFQILGRGQGASIVNLALDPSLIGAQARFFGDIDAMATAPDMVDMRRMLDPIMGRHSERMDWSPPLTIHRRNGVATTYRDSPGRASLAVHPYLTPRYPHDRRPRTTASNSTPSDTHAQGDGASEGQAAESLLNCLQRYSHGLSDGRTMPSSSSSSNPIDNAAAGEAGAQATSAQRLRSHTREGNVAEATIIADFRPSQMAEDMGEFVLPSRAYRDRNGEFGLRTSVYSTRSPSPLVAPHVRSLWTYAPPGDGGDALPRFFSCGQPLPPPDTLGALERLGTSRFKDLSDSAKIDYHILTTIRDMVKDISTEEAEIRSEHDKEDAERNKEIKEKKKQNREGSKSATRGSDTDGQASSSMHAGAAEVHGEVQEERGSAVEIQSSMESTPAMENERNQEEVATNAVSMQPASISPAPVITIEVNNSVPGLAAEDSEEEAMESEAPVLEEGESPLNPEVVPDTAPNDTEMQVDGNAEVESRDNEITPRTADNDNNENNAAGENNAVGEEPDVSAIVAQRCSAAGLELSAAAVEGGEAQAAALSTSGIDPSFLIPLPPEFRAEVLTQHFEQQEVSNPTTGDQNIPETSMFTVEFLRVLPPNVRREVLEGEVNFQIARARRASRARARSTPGEAGGGVGEEIDNASFLASLDPELREEIFLTSDESLLATLPPAVAAEARMVRDREHRRVSPSSSGARILDPYVISRYSGERRGRRGHESSRHSAEWVLKDGEWEYTRKHREKDVTPSLSPHSLTAIINLLRIPQNLGKGLINRVLSIACKNPTARQHIMHSIFDVVMHGPRRSITPREVSTEVSYAPRSVIIRRGLDLLTSLVKNEDRVAEDFVAIPRRGQSISAGSSKDAGKPAEGTVMVTQLARLLSDPVFGKSDTHVEQLMTLLVAACDALPPKVTKVVDKSKTKKTKNLGEAVESNADGDNAAEEAGNSRSADQSMSVDVEANDEPVPSIDTNEARQPENDPERDSSGGAAGVQRNAGTGDQPGSGDKSEKKAKEKRREVRIPVERRVPRFYDDDLVALASVLDKDGLTEKTYSRTIQVVNTLSELPANRRTLIDALSNAVSLSGKNVADRFISFINELQGLSPVEEKAAISRFSMSSLPDELRLLRVAKTISALSKKVELHREEGKESDRKSADKNSADKNGAGKNTEEVDAHAYDILTKAFGGIYSLWACLDRVLQIIGEAQRGSKDSEDDASSARGRSLRALNSSRRSGRHTVPPALALLCPVVETFFVAHSLPGDSHRKPAHTQGDSLSRPGSPRLDATKSIAEQPHDNFAIILGAFIEKHRGPINTILRGNPSLLDGSFRSAICHASMIDFDNKKAYFRSLIRKRNSDTHASSIRITIPRDSVFASSYNHLRMRSPQEMKGRLHVQFAGEEGIDAGGLTREWYTILIRNMFDPMYALFKRSAGKAATYQPDRRSYVNPEQHLDYFRFVGRIIGKAIYDGQLLDAYFARSFYKHILGIKPSYHDMELEEPEYYNSLCWILENDITEVMDLTMSAEFDYFGTQKTVDLIPNGQNIPVTNENKMQYVQLVTDLRLTKAIEKQIDAFLKGFHELIPAEDIRIFNEVELELLMSGLPDIDVSDLKANIEYSGFTASSVHISWFWKSIAKMGGEDLARLIMFVTGTSKVPLEGFAALQGMNGPQKFQIHRVPGDTDRLPTAHTCFNQLDLPEYDSEEKLHNRLLCAIREGSEGFGFG